MAFSFNPALPADKDWVRALIGDTVEVTVALQDETIAAVLATEPNKWYAAAQCGEMAFARWQSKGEGVVEKAVGDLRLNRGEGMSASAAYRAYLNSLRARGAEVLSPAPYAFKVV